MVSQVSEMTEPNAKLYYRIGWKEEVIELTSSLKTEDILFTMSEYERLELRFEKGRNIKEIRVEALQGEGEILLTEKAISLTDGADNQESVIIPGVYLIKLVDERNVEFHRYFEVISHNLSSNQLEKMKEVLESRVIGITRDFNSQREVMSTGNESEATVSEFGLMVKYFKELEQALDNISKTPIEALKKEYQLTKMPKKPSARGQRWAAIKGERYQEENGTIPCYEARMALDLDTTENRYLKYNLNEILTVALRVSKQYRFNDSGILTQINQLKTDILKAKQERQKIEKSYNIAKIKNLMDFEIVGKTKELEQLKKQRSSTVENQRKLKTITSKLMYVLNETWLRDVRMDSRSRLTKRASKNYHYLFVHELTQKLMLSKKGQNLIPTFPFLETSRLFEFYNFIMCIDLLEKQGFKWVSGWIKDCHSVRKMMYSLNAGEELWFENNKGYKVQMMYDKFLNNTSTAKLQGVPQLVTATSSSRRPDILISLYNDKTEFLTSMIIEVKYRRLKHIYKEEAETDVVRQLLDYETLRYYHPSQMPLFKAGAVSKVVVVYPEQEGAYNFIDSNYGYAFIPVEPIGYESTITGVSEVERHLAEFLINCQ